MRYFRVRWPGSAAASVRLLELCRFSWFSGRIETFSCCPDFPDRAVGKHESDAARTGISSAAAMSDAAFGENDYRYAAPAGGELAGRGGDFATAGRRCLRAACRRSWPFRAWSGCVRCCFRSLLKLAVSRMVWLREVLLPLVAEAGRVAHDLAA
ncbi:hypothetical protein [Amycolatopsis sp. NPDC003676]